MTIIKDPKNRTSDEYDDETGDQGNFKFSRYNRDKFIKPRSLKSLLLLLIVIIILFILLKNMGIELPVW